MDNDSTTDPADTKSDTSSDDDIRGHAKGDHKTPPPTVTMQRQVAPPLFQAWSSFGAGDAGETDLREGEIVHVLDVTGTGWWQVRSEAGIGWVPDHFLRPAPPDDSAANQGVGVVYYGVGKDFLNPKVPQHRKEQPKPGGHVANRFLKQFKEERGIGTSHDATTGDKAEKLESTTEHKRSVKDEAQELESTTQHKRSVKDKAQELESTTQHKRSFKDLLSKFNHT